MREILAGDSSLKVEIERERSERLTVLELDEGKVEIERLVRNMPKERLLCKLEGVGARCFPGSGSG